MARPFYSAPNSAQKQPIICTPIGLAPFRFPQYQVSVPDQTAINSDGAASSHQTPWMTDQLIEQIRRRNSLKKQADSSKNQSDIGEYEKCRRKVAHQILMAKNRFCLAYPHLTDEVMKVRGGQSFECRSCDQSFRSQHALDMHLSQHARCTHQDCSFTASQGMVEKHVMMHHETGLADAIMALNTPEAIAKWRDERRKNFATVANAERRQKEYIDRIIRGERIGLKQVNLGHPKDRNNRLKIAQTKSQSMFSIQKRHQRNARLRHRAEDSDEETPSLPMFPGIEHVESHHAESQPHTTVADERDITASGDCHKRARCSSPDLTDEFSSDKYARCDNLGIAERSTDVSEPISGLQSKNRGVSADIGDDLESQRSESCNSVLQCQKTSVERLDNINAGTESSAVVVDNDRGSRRSRNRRGRQRGNGRLANLCSDRNDRNQTRRRRMTLLEKLLRPDIRRERNVILQCIRYIVSNSFFDGQPLFNQDIRAGNETNSVGTCFDRSEMLSAQSSNLCDSKTAADGFTSLSLNFDATANDEDSFLRQPERSGTAVPSAVAQCQQESVCPAGDTPGVAPHHNAVPPRLSADCYIPRCGRSAGLVTVNTSDISAENKSGSVDGGGCNSLSLLNCLYGSDGEESSS